MNGAGLRQGPTPQRAPANLKIHDNEAVTP